MARGNGNRIRRSRLKCFFRHSRYDVHMEEATGKTLYFEVGTTVQKVLLKPGLSSDDVKNLLWATTNTDSLSEVVTIYDKEGRYFTPDATLPENTPEKPYAIVISPYNGSFLRSLSLDFMELAQRICEVERAVNSLPFDVVASTGDFLKALEALKCKLQIKDYVNKLDLNKDQFEEWEESRKRTIPYWRHVEYRRKLEEEVVSVVSKFQEICDSEISQGAKACLELPSFNNWAWKDWEILRLVQHMYVELGLLERLDIDIETLRSFLCALYLNYNQVPFHNFLHAFCVTQMMYGIVWKCRLIERLNLDDVLILLTSCICHDLDHPGFNNIYQINARTELALRYNDISPLENHHCAVAFQILERKDCNIFRKVSKEDYKKIREGIIRCILATDMARHNEILHDFKEIISEFDFSNRSHVNLLFMILIKVADISNEARPLDIAEPWLECLLQEFFNQSDLEKMEGLPVSPFMDREKVTKPSSQCSFIGFVLLPLFEALGEVLPELEDLIIQPVRDALDHYKQLKQVNEGSKKSSTSYQGEEQEIEEETFKLASPEKKTRNDEAKQEKQRLLKGDSSHSLKSRCSRTSFYSKSFAACDSADLEELNLPETEVEVSERTSRFKIFTDARKPSSRRNSAEPAAVMPSESNSGQDLMLSPNFLTVFSEGGKRIKPLNEDKICSEGLKETSLLSRIREKLGADRDKNQNCSTSKSRQKKTVPMLSKEQRSKSVPYRNKFAKNFNINKPKIMLKHVSIKATQLKYVNSNDSSVLNLPDPQCEMRVSPSLELKKHSNNFSNKPSPTLSDKYSGNSSSVMEKNFSVSLERLPKREFVSRQHSITPHNSHVCSDDVLDRENQLSALVSLQKCSKENSGMSSHLSPKTNKKRLSSPKYFRFKQFPFIRKTSEKSTFDKELSSNSFHVCRDGS